jgi:hypothetical protein
MVFRSLRANLARRLSRRPEAAKTSAFLFVMALILALIGGGALLLLGPSQGAVTALVLSPVMLIFAALLLFYALSSRRVFVP